MTEILNSFRFGVRLLDLIDIAIVAFIVYRLLLLIKGTRAMQMLLGLGVVGLGFFVSSTFGLFTTHWLLSHFFDYLIVIIIVLFQDDLRRALTHVGKTSVFTRSVSEAEKERLHELCKAASILATQKRGALLVIERDTGLKNFIETGSPIDAQINSELIVSLFQPTSPLHDGAVIISGDRIASAACFLPLSQDPDIDKRYGTRHRAAMGLSEETDAIIIIVSEETGNVHLVSGGKITTNMDEDALYRSLSIILNLLSRPERLTSKIKSWFGKKKRKTP